MLDIHPTSVVDRSAVLGDDIHVGPNCYVGPKAILGNGCRLHNNVTIVGHTRVGAGNEFFPSCVIGTAPQDLKYRGTDTQVVIGEDNVFREQVTVHAGTEVAGGVTQIGSHNRFLVGSHIAHDCIIGNHCILANGVQLAGHCCLEDRVTMGGIIGVHHFVTIGTLSYIAGMSRLTVDAPPYMIMAGYSARVRGVNSEGLSRWGFAEDRVQRMREVYKLLFSRRATAEGRTVLEKIASLEQDGRANEDVQYLCDFIKRSSRDGVYGRYRESLRSDSDADRKGFYATGAVAGTEEATA
jgi:UDP-N-acetylglucosamine acyltransferase